MLSNEDIQGDVSRMAVITMLTSVRTRTRVPHPGISHNRVNQKPSSKESTPLSTIVKRNIKSLPYDFR
ncbi:hypothetical protein SUGI_0548890 [Cryptomeria japonica]|nr:hypothetical protein SUGI_0548890 [Cryptomeria japonica]